MSEPKPSGKPFDIDKGVVMEAYRRVAANKGAPGVDEVSIAEFEQDLKNNLYKLWNRLSSGTYFPPPVRAVEIPKSHGPGVRVLGVPTVADRVAQTVVRLYLEPLVEPVFHPDSYGYRPGRSALEAVATCRVRCWERDWVIDLDIAAFFDTVPHEQILAAVEHHTELSWIRLYVARWLCAPIQQVDGTLHTRDRGTPQGSAISPLLANLFMHYAFDAWMARTYPQVHFERYCDDAVVHCVSYDQAVAVREAIAHRLAEFGLELHPEKTRIIYCKDSKRTGRYPDISFTFLGYDFRPRKAVGKNGTRFTGFLPAVSTAAKKKIGNHIRSWRLGRHTGSTLQQLARLINPVVAGWVTYYGRFYRSEVTNLLARLNRHLLRWATNKHKGLGRRKARQRLAEVARAYPGLFAHWKAGAYPIGWATGAV
ncbi:MAG: group II intron reverse transcriptase/maturase [Pseudonocardiales bacterium]|nr:group II intron reverse transcriptase/maturase [Pseudonocardiales bacterium]MBV9730478.1 group II intron reverse transcriptase/maturase [Pseudonocardiales bacterium]